MRMGLPRTMILSVSSAELPSVARVPFTVTTFCVVDIPFEGQLVKPPYACAHILLDGADGPAAALAMLVEEGKLGWDDRLTQHMPEFKMADPAVTTSVPV